MHSTRQVETQGLFLVFGGPADDARLDELDQKWSNRFNRLEALQLARTLDKPDPEPTFHPVKVTPTHIHPVGSVKATEPFMKPTDRPHLATN